MSNALATRANLFRRTLTPDPLCSFCHLYPETIEHVLLSCPWAVQVWFCHPLGYLPNLQQISSLDNWLLDLTFPPSLLKKYISEVYTHICFILWNIWKHRCHCVFNNVSPNPMVVAFQAFDASTEFLFQGNLAPICSLPQSFDDHMSLIPHWSPL